MATTTDCLANSVEWQRKALDELQRVKPFGDDVPEEELACLVAVAQDMYVSAGTKIVDQKDDLHYFTIFVEGKAHVSRKDTQGNYFFSKIMEAPAFMGEVPLLSGLHSNVTVIAQTDIRGLLLDEESFWSGMSHCPHLRSVILGEMRMRLMGMQTQQTQQAKLAMLGTMTAGLMHELNNPGAAARRAASQLRDNLRHMHEIARSFSEHGHTEEQRACLTALQERALAVKKDVCLSSLEQSDAEEEMGAWLDSHSITKAWDIAPVMVASGITTRDLDCLADVFQNSELTAPLEWLEATASSMQMVTLVEESVARVTELAQSVKSYAHEGQTGEQDVDVNESIHATFVMMKHKLREKNISVHKEFGAMMPKVHCVCSGLNQVWTNLLDNAIDAVPPAGGLITIRTQRVGDEIQVTIGDNGSGISAEDRDRIFDPFFTTKAAGVGTGLGLGIVRRVLEGYGGRLTLESVPGKTEFTVHLPAEQAK
jgi:signal transduction histidine kinase